MSIQRETETESDAERVLESFREPCLESREVTGDKRRFTDENDMRREYGIAPFDADAFRYGIIPDLLSHEWEPSEGRVAGGTDLLATGKPGSGKSTLAAYLAIRLVEINDEKVVWRGSPSRSEWLPVARWSTLWLPDGEVDAVLEPKNKTRGSVEVDVDELEDIVREVRRYRSTRDLLELMDRGINVVYPDPELRGCQEVLDRSARLVDTPPDRDELFSSEDPTKHWWFGWFLDRVDRGPHDFTTWIADEIGDIAPQNAPKDSFGSYQKIELLKDSWVDARKHGLSVFAFGHDESDLSSMIRKKIRWRIAMPTSANPTSASGLSGFESVPMRTDITSNWGPGRAIAFDESAFQQFGWSDTSVGHNWTVKIRPLGGH